MKLPLFIAFKYFFSRSTPRAINLISGISLLGVVVGTAALIILLSVFNGLETLVLDLQNAFTPDVLLKPNKGKNFVMDQAMLQRLRSLDGVAYAVPTLEENALFRYRERQLIGRVKGVDPEFIQARPVAQYLLAGEPALMIDSFPVALLGAGVDIELGISTSGGDQAVGIYLPRADFRGSDFSQAFVMRHIYPVGAFSVQAGWDQKVILVPLQFAWELMQGEQLLSAIEITLKERVQVRAVKEQVAGIAGPEFQVLDRLQQDVTLYRILRSERWALYLIVSFVLFLALFNLVGSMTLIVLDKQADAALLQAMGAREDLLRRIFISLGMLITLAGATLGLFIGALFGWAQNQFGFIQASELLGEVYPVSLRGGDFILVLFTVVCMGSVASIIAARRNIKNLPSIRDILVREGT